ncbi:hypothetical protein GE09DRAFT_1264490, partial [Coniochaeta sp. 2T2.1]
SRGATASTYQTRFAPRSRSPLPSHKSRDSVGSGSLRARTDSLVGKSFGQGGDVVELQAQDGGFGAWSYVAAAFSMYIAVWGEVPQAFPIFRTYLSTGPDAAYPDSIAIRLLAPGLQDIEGGILFSLHPRSSSYRRPIVISGIFIMLMSLVLAANCQQDGQIVLTQGISFGIGGILLNYVHASIFPEWFNQKKGQAMGIIWTGWRVGAIAFPLVCQVLLDEHGFHKTIYVLIAPMLSLLIPAVILLRGRYQGASVSVTPPEHRVSKWQGLRTPSVLYYIFATTLFFIVANALKMFIIWEFKSRDNPARGEAFPGCNLRRCDFNFATLSQRPWNSLHPFRCHCVLCLHHSTK